MYRNHLILSTDGILIFIQNTRPFNLFDAAQETTFGMSFVTTNIVGRDLLNARISILHFLVLNWQWGCERLGQSSKFRDSSSASGL